MLHNFLNCTIQYESSKEAQDAYANIDGIIFPRDTGRKVQVGGLTPEQAEALIGQEQAAASKSMKLDWEKAIEAVSNGEELESTGSPADQGEARRPRFSGIGQITRELRKGMHFFSALSTKANIIFSCHSFGFSPCQCLASGGGALDSFGTD